MLRAGVSEPWLFYCFMALASVWLLAMRHAVKLARYLPESLKRGKLPTLRQLRRLRRASRTIQ
jgi:hypothetical protein